MNWTSKNVSKSNLETKKKKKEITMDFTSNSSNEVLFDGYPVKNFPKNSTIDHKGDGFLWINNVKYELENEIWVPLKGQIVGNPAPQPIQNTNISVGSGIGILNVAKGTRVVNKF